MGGQILGGGAIVFVVAALWLVYLLPTWQTKMRYNAAERNAVRLNQALRVLAESSETPGEVRVELSRQEAAKQWRLVKRLEAEDDRLREEYDQAEVERRRRENDAKLARTKRDAAASQFAREIAAEERRQELAALRTDPRLRRARARRRVRLAATALAVTGLVVSAVGVWQFAMMSTWALLAVGVAAVVLALGMHRRMATVAARAARPAPVTVEAAPATAPVESRSQILDPADRGWTPRRLPAPLTATAGSRASDAVDAARERERVAQAAREDVARERIARRQEPVPFVARDAGDEEIERHVRELLARRAAS
ncbi:hypothetical protein GCM10010915_12310 [Microbacterium faecale]|uniref:Large exoprotein n=1 Tax=Microbacterium faecale TaxID=1804630 RepID=A0A917DFA0_9MICO|nr:large exoprotein [Microbacterium faecale]GGD33483.1 hypothetical protein GCM10010915_12310 [Microbacterium faecale]